MNKKSKKRALLVISLFILLILSVIGIVYVLGGLNIKSNNDIESVKKHNEQLGLTDKPVTESDKANHHAEDNKPRFITIDNAGVNRARVQEIGLLDPSSDGSQQMDVPKNINDVGWYNCQINPVESLKCERYVAPSTVADSINSSDAVVLDGHSCGRGKCVFDNIYKLNSGDVIKVEMGNGSIIEYSVSHVETVGVNSVDMNKVVKSIDPNKPGLNLITCSGSWTSVDSRGAISMDKRTIVYAVQASLNRD